MRCGPHPGAGTCRGWGTAATRPIWLQERWAPHTHTQALTYTVAALGQRAGGCPHLPGSGPTAASYRMSQSVATGRSPGSSGRAGLVSQSPGPTPREGWGTRLTAAVKVQRLVLEMSGSKKGQGGVGSPRGACEPQARAAETSERHSCGPSPGSHAHSLGPGPETVQVQLEQWSGLGASPKAAQCRALLPLADWSLPGAAGAGEAEAEVEALCVRQKAGQGLAAGQAPRSSSLHSAELSSPGGSRQGVAPLPWSLSVATGREEGAVTQLSRGL